jgi:hypothetical protein
MEEVFVLSAVRTPIGKYGGGLSPVPPCDLAAQVIRALSDPFDGCHMGVTAENVAADRWLRLVFR